MPRVSIGAYILNKNYMRRFSVKELRKWIAEAATKAIKNDKAFQKGVAFYKRLPGGVSVVIAWSEDGDYEYDEANPFQRFDKVETCCGRLIKSAYNLEISLRITESDDPWGNSPSEWLFWDTYMPWTQTEGLEGVFSFNQKDLDDQMKSMASEISKRRTQYCKVNKYYDNRKYKGIS